MSISIRTIANAEDVAACLELLCGHFESDSNPHRETLAPNWRETWEKALTASLARNDHHNLLLTQKDGELAGCLLSWIRAAGMLVNEATLIISELFVVETSRRKGFAKVLVESAKVWAHGREVRRIEIQTPYGSDGQAFWESMGFAPVTLSMVHEIDQGNDAT